MGNKKCKTKIITTLNSLIWKKTIHVERFDQRSISDEAVFHSIFPSSVLCIFKLMLSAIPYPSDIEKSEKK